MLTITVMYIHTQGKRIAACCFEKAWLKSAAQIFPPRFACIMEEVLVCNPGVNSMGMERSITFDGPNPSWQSIRDQIAARGLTVQLRMIDGLPAFPDESPEEGWRELRFSTAGGMMTLRLEPGRLSATVWGNSGPDLVREWDEVVQACIVAANGRLNAT
jgi:hypothetical protein